MQLTVFKISGMRYQVGADSFDSTIVRVVVDGTKGVGEAAVGAFPDEFAEWTGSVAAAIPCFVEALGEDPIEFASLEELTEKFGRFRGNSFAKGALDCACHDALARKQGIPLWQAIGGTKRSIALTTPLAVSQSIDDVLSAASESLQRGAASLTLKLRPGWGLEVVRAMRATFPMAELRVDLDGSATLDQRDLLFRLQDYQVAAIEQPLDADDLVGHAMLQESLRVPICLDQSITSLAKARQAIDLGACRQIRVAPDKSGGLITCLQIARACREANIECLVGTRARTIVGLRHAAALASVELFAPMLELEFSPLINPPAIQLWEDPGIGIDPTSNL